MRILCLDIGSKRIGVAATDPMGWTAQGQGVIIRRGDERDFEAVAEYCRDLEPQFILVGLPLDAESERGPQAKKVEGFVDRLKRYLGEHDIDLPVTYWDERYSTAEAEQRLIDADVSRAKRRAVIDKMAAVVILEDYLDVHPLSDDSEGGGG